MAQVKKTRSAAGNGTIRKRKDGTWEGRYTAGTDPKTGRQIRRSLSINRFHVACLRFRDQGDQRFFCIRNDP